MIASANLPPELSVRLRRVAISTGLSTSDLVRQGLVRVVTEVEATGELAIGPVAPLAPPTPRWWIRDNH